VAEIRDRVFAGCDVKPHIHADAAIGWAMIFFNDYDFAENPHGFDRETVEGLRRRQDLFRNLRYADSITMDFHKTGYTPYAASMVLIRNRDDLIPFKWKPGTFRYFNPEEIEIAPVQYTLECTRSPEAVFSITGNLLAFGIEGYQVCLGWAIQVSNHLRRRLAELPYVGIINPDEGGLSTVFRVYPRGADGKAELKRELTDPGYRAKLEENSRFSQELFRRRDKQLTVWDAKLDYTSAGTWAPYDHETPIPGWKAYILNPRVTIESVDRFIEGLGKHHAAFEPAAANEDGRGELSPPRPRATET
jgi:glutamate/tyrosine decarboxylase-like PLP-dependent enzyme